MFISYDLENFPLQIKTDSVVGSNEKVHVGFGNTAGDYAGFVSLFLTSPPQYWLGNCKIYRANFSTVLPLETDKVWTISLKRFSGKGRVSITCNNKEVLDLVLSNTNCSLSMWSNYWSRDVNKIYFSHSDTASDFYRPGKHVQLFVGDAHSKKTQPVNQFWCIEWFLWLSLGFLLIFGFFIFCTLVSWIRPR